MMARKEVKGRIWQFRQTEGFDSLHKLRGTTPEPHEGYFRENNGSWTVTDEQGEPIARICFRGKAKRGEAWNAPDPEGQSYARLIAAAPEMYDALKGLLHRHRDGSDEQHWAEWDTAREAVDKAER